MRNENVNKPQNQQSCQNAVSDSAVVEDKIFYDGNGGWEKQSYRDAMKNFQEKFHNEFFHKVMNNGFEIADKRKEQNQDNLKWAWIKIGNSRKMCWVDNVTNKAYKADGYGKTNIEIKNFSFERWCTGFDL
jgi:hypothetical protein